MGKYKGPEMELFHADDDKWYFHKKAANGKITAQSQGYKQKRYAIVAIRRDFPQFPLWILGEAPDA